MKVSPVVSVQCLLVTPTLMAASDSGLTPPREPWTTVQDRSIVDGSWLATRLVTHG